MRFLRATNRMSFGLYSTSEFQLAQRRNKELDLFYVNPVLNLNMY